ncbi:MAG: MazG family protein [Lachnospiraceae bacterium]|nr:MazG family protein [Lachnospiraceae bacterium]
MTNNTPTLQALEKFIHVVKELRSEHGCPWDKAQTHESLRMQLIEEAYEAADAMLNYKTKGEIDNLREELGDILLQVVLHSVIAEEEQIFTLEDVVKEITEKMIHRHPHVFAPETMIDGVKSWEELKAEEKGHKKETIPPLHGIPKALPALLRSAKVQKKAAVNYHHKMDSDFSISQVTLLASQLENVTTKVQKEKIMTSMLYHMTNIAWQENINLEECLMKNIDTIIEALEP